VPLVSWAALAAFFGTAPAWAAPTPAAQPRAAIAPHGGASAAARAPARAASAAPAGTNAAPDAGQRAFASARERLLQVRTLLKGQDSQASVGSGFLVTDEGHLVTNYHVVSQYALRPAQYRLVYATSDGRQGALQLLDIDVVHDLAVLKPVEPGAFTGRGVLPFRPQAEVLQRGERIHSLGNPLDVGFAVMSGAYNGLAERHFLPVIFFGGSLSAGMSGGPALDERGRVVGVNVAARRDGEQVSFLVPATFAQELLARARNATPMVQPAYPRLVQQLTQHQEALTRDFLAQPWRASGHPHYAIPVPQEQHMRCWGRSTPAEGRGLQFERSDCVMDSRIFVSGSLLSGYFSVRHEAYDGQRIGTLRFIERHSRSFQNEPFGNSTRQMSASQCHQDTVAAADGRLPLRAVMCLRAYKRLPGLYDLSLLVATLDGRVTGAQGRFDAHGVSFENAGKLAAHYLAGFGVQPPQALRPPQPQASKKGAP
jgi:S1-C subfamily serine protease